MTTKNSINMMNQGEDCDDAADVPTTWAGQPNSAGGSVSPGLGSIGISTSSGGTISRGSQAGNLSAGSGQNIWAGITNAMSFTLMTPPAKDDVAYIIVLNDNSCLELEEQPRLTGRELIGLCKFFNVISAAQNGKVDVKWSELVSALGIERHFVPGQSNHLNYDTDCKTLFIFLIDAK